MRPRGIGLRLLVAAACCAAATLIMWRVLQRSTLLAATAIGIAGGVAIGILVCARRLPRTVRMMGVAAITWVAAALAAGTWRGPLRVPGALSTFLSIGLPASGLDGLALVPVTVALPATALAVWGAITNRPVALIGGPLVALVSASLMAAPLGVARWPVAAAATGLLATIALSAQHRHRSFEQLLQDPGARRTQILVPALVAGVIATGLGGAALVAPHREAFDIRRFVEPRMIELADENPLARAARLQVDPPETATEIDATVEVRGASPGRLRLAVLDGYTSQGWHQVATYSVTGRALAGDPLFGDQPRTAADQAVRITVRQGPGTSGLLGVPTAGLTSSVDNPNGVRYSPAAGVLLATEQGRAATVGYATWPIQAKPAVEGSALAGGTSATLQSCPETGLVRDTAQALAGGSDDPVLRLRRIESWLKLRRVYDPKAPGGQTIGSVEAFLSQELGRGNMESFVTSFALLARCADVPARIVVGYPAPAANDTTEYRATQLSAWVEVPLAGAAWVAFDPVPTPDEQQRQAQVAQQPPPPQTPVQTTPPPPARDVEPENAVATNQRWVWWLVAVVAAVALLAGAWAMLGPRLIHRRRRHAASPADAVHGAWEEIAERLRGAGVPRLAHFTPQEIAIAAHGRVPRLAAELARAAAPLADHARYAGHSVEPADAERAWGLAEAMRHNLPVSRAHRLRAVRHPLRTIAELRQASRVPRARRAWNGRLADDWLVIDRVEAEHIVGVHLAERIGEGSTAVVYRGTLIGEGVPVAVKVFRASVEGRHEDRRRFEWEAQIAAMVSGQPNLPVVYASGVTIAGQPYLVTDLYQRGTLRARVQRGGPLSAGEVLTIGRALALALDTLHGNSVLHGDVKPENVFIHADGTPVLGDLGSAWLRAEGGPSAALTPPYAAPEVWRGGHPSPASDIYALGLTLMFAATGRVPVAGVAPQPHEIIEAFGTDRYLALLDAEPARRPRTAREAARLLGANVDDPSLSWRTALVLPTPAISGSVVLTRPLGLPPE